MKIKIAKPGFNAITETDPDNLIFSSDYNTFKYDISGSTTITIPSSGSPDTGEFTIVTHNLGYIPFFTVVVKDTFFTPNRFYILPYSFADAFVWDYWFVYATTTALIFRYENSSYLSSLDLDLYYKIFKNNLGL